MHVLRAERSVELVGLLTTVNEVADRVAMHAVRRELLQAQARAIGLPLWIVPLPWPCSNREYETRMQRAIARARRAGVTHIAFGDLFLEDVRHYRETQLNGTGIDPLFPIWGLDTERLAREMLASGLRAIVSCVDPAQLSGELVGRTYDERLLAELPAGVDPCGERGEFHTFCYAGPMFRRPLTVRVGQRVLRDGFWFADILPCEDVPDFPGRARNESSQAASGRSQRRSSPPACRPRQPC